MFRGGIKPYDITNLSGRGGAGDGTGGESAATMETGAGVSSIFITSGAGAGETVFFARVSLWHLLHMPPVEALPKKPQPAEQRVGAEVSAVGWFDSMDAEGVPVSSKSCPSGRLSYVRGGGG